MNLLEKNNTEEIRKYLNCAYPNNHPQPWQIEDIIRQIELEEAEHIIGMTRAVRNSCDKCGIYGYFETYNITITIPSMIIKREYCHICLNSLKEEENDKHYRKTMLLKKQLNWELRNCIKTI